MEKILYVCIHVQYMGVCVHMCAEYCACGECRCADACSMKDFQESVQGTWHLCNLWHSFNGNFQWAAAWQSNKGKRYQITKVWEHHINYLHLVLYVCFSRYLESSFYAHTEVFKGNCRSQIVTTDLNCRLLKQVHQWYKNSTSLLKC